MPDRFPSLPIITPDPPTPPRRPARERYGALWYLGLGGLIVVIAMVSWFAIRAWSLRGIWTQVYVLHDPSRRDEDRIRAAWALTREPGVTQRQLWDIALRKPLPDLARYLVAERLTAEAIESDPLGYAKVVAYSEDWPPWLRLVMIRPLAYGAGSLDGRASEPLLHLVGRGDPIAALWARFTLAGSSPDNPAPREALARVAELGGPEAPLAALLLQALDLEGDQRVRKLDQATIWTRRHHPALLEIAKGWTVEGDHLVKSGQAPSASPN